jgi:hypothetical protein
MVERIIAEAASGDGMTITVGTGVVAAVGGILARHFWPKRNGENGNGKSYVTKDFCQMQHGYVTDSLKRIEGKLDRILEPPTKAD